MKQRDRIRMSHDEIVEFLHGRRTMTVATIGRDGRPHLTAMWYGFLDNAPAFETYAKSQKVLNLRRDPRITCLVEAGDAYDNLRGVQLIGSAEIVEDDDRKHVVALSVIERYWQGTPEADREAAAQALMNKRVGVKVNVDEIVSWDHSKLA